QHRQIVWDIAKWTHLETLPSGAEQPAFSRDGTRLASASGVSPKVRIHELPLDAKRVSTLSLPDTSRATSAIFSIDGKTLYTLDWKFEREGWYRVAHWQIPTGKQIAAWDVQQKTYGILLGPDGKTVFAYSGEGVITVQDAPSGHKRLFQL